MKFKSALDSVGWLGNYGNQVLINEEQRRKETMTSKREEVIEVIAWKFKQAAKFALSDKMLQESLADALLERFCMGKHLYHSGCDTTVYACHKEGICDRCGRARKEGK